MQREEKHLVNKKLNLQLILETSKSCFRHVRLSV